MYEQHIQEDLIYMMLYAAAAMMSLLACCYLLFRRANAIAPDVTSPVRLRRWTAVFFASMTLSHLWYLPIVFLTSREDIMLCYLLGTMLDFMILIPSAIVLLLVMLQDRRRPLWPVCMIVAPPIIGLAIGLATRSIARLPLLYIYYLLLGIGLLLYMVHEVRRYGRWLRNNYADLEHKEVWQSFIVLAVIVLVFGIYTLSLKGTPYHYVVQLNDIVLVCYLLWRVETLSDLSISSPQDDLPEEADDSLASLTVAMENEEENAVSLSIRNIGSLLKQHCEEPQLYLQHDISVTQLAMQIGTNRFYLSQYFTNEGISYNTYINGLCIQHFINRYHGLAKDRQAIITKHLAYESGFRSYSTFGVAFKQIMGMTATEWMRDQSAR